MRTNNKSISGWTGDNVDNVASGHGGHGGDVDSVVAVSPLTGHEGRLYDGMMAGLHCVTSAPARGHTAAAAVALNSEI